MSRERKSVPRSRAVIWKRLTVVIVSATVAIAVGACGNSAAPTTIVSQPAHRANGKLTRVEYREMSTATDQLDHAHPHDRAGVEHVLAICDMAQRSALLSAASESCGNGFRMGILQSVMSSCFAHAKHAASRLCGGYGKPLAIVSGRLAAAGARINHIAATRHLPRACSDYLGAPQAALYAIRQVAIESNSIYQLAVSDELGPIKTTLRDERKSYALYKKSAGSTPKTVSVCPER